MKPLAVRRAEAEARAAAWAALTPEQKLSSLDARGVIARWQRVRITMRLAPPYPRPPVEMSTLDRVVLTTEERPSRPRHKKGKRGDGRRSR